MINTKIYTTNKWTARKFANACGVNDVIHEDHEIGFGFDKRRKDNDCVTGFQSGSGFDTDHDMKEITVDELNRMKK